MSQARRLAAKSCVMFLALAIAWSGIAGAQGVVLTPLEIIKLGLEADANLKIAALNLDNARIAYERSVANNRLGGSPAALRSAEIEWLRAQSDYQNQVADAVISLLQQAIDLRRAEIRAQVEEKRLAQARLEYERARERVRAQIANEDSVVEAELAMVGRELSFDDASIALENEKESLARRIGVAAFSLGEMPPFVPYTANAEEALAKAREASADLRQGQVNVENAELELERLRIENAPAMDLRQAANNLEIAKIRLASIETQLKESVESAARAVARTAVNYEIAARQLELARRRESITRRQAEAGFVAQDAVVNAEIAVLEAESARLEALKNYLTAVLNFEKLSGADVTQSVVLRGGSNHGEGN